MNNIECNIRLILVNQIYIYNIKEIILIIYTYNYINN